VDIKTISAVIILAPFVGFIIAGGLGNAIKRAGVNWVTIGLLSLSLCFSVWVAYDVFVLGHQYYFNFYTWGTVGQLKMNIGLQLNQLTVFMMLIITFVSLLVHVYSIGYMADDSSYTRFFSYISGFTFAMLTLVMTNNFLLLFFGWEGVGLFSYLLISFWFEKDKSTYAGLKAFLVNRVGDLGFMVGIAIVLYYFNSLDYRVVFEHMAELAKSNPMIHFFWWDVNGITLMAVFLFIGAMGKSAQVPLHTWLEGSMEGPTPISALIHAATMVTAGVFMVARLSPIFEYSVPTMSLILVVGGSTCLFMGLLAIVQMDIKRVIAYCTLSQLGYMMAAQGASAFSIGLFHLMTHAMFKALLFLAAGSVILGMHHEQDMSKMGGIKKYMPITYVCTLIGALALSAIPPFSGFFSKDSIIDVVGLSNIPGSSYAFFMVTACAFVTAFYTFRMFFYVFHGKERLSPEHKAHIKESSFPVIIALILLAIPAAFAGILFFEPALNGFFGDSIYIAPSLNVVTEYANEPATQSAWIFMKHSVHTLPFWLAISGVILSYILYVLVPSVPGKIAKIFKPVYWFMLKKYLIDDFFDIVLGKGSWLLGYILWKVGDIFIIDKGMVHGSANLTYFMGGRLRKAQTGYLYHYNFVLVLGLAALIAWMFFIN
jgi:NADH-quinone oxidoreductase subunit L